LHCLGYVGQYLPDWRPSIDYSENYSAKKDMGGGVLLDLSHEINIVSALMGRANDVFCRCGRISELNIDSEDFADVLLSHERAASVIHLNYLEREYTWHTRVTGENGTLIWYFDQGRIVLERNKERKLVWECPADFSRDMLFERQMRHFLDVVSGMAKPVVSYRDAVESLAIVEAAKLSNKTGSAVKVK
jgi:predicted dehydrogenase